MNNSVFSGKALQDKSYSTFSIFFSSKLSFVFDCFACCVMLIVFEVSCIWGPKLSFQPIQGSFSFFAQPITCFLFAAAYPGVSGASGAAGATGYRDARPSIHIPWFL